MNSNYKDTINVNTPGEVRVRFAPAPTGHLHVGGARTALFNYLFAKRYGGKFILRLEDTDPARSNESYYECILESLKWLGLDWDEGPDRGGPYGPYRQSERRHIYDAYIRELLSADAAYECFCSQRELDERRQAMQAAGLAPRYDGRCARFSTEEREKKRAAGIRPCIRFRLPTGADLSFNDLIRGRVTFRPEDLDDFVIARPDGAPTYNFVCVIDDALMKVTHVIRGEDHISNTPRQLAVYRALGKEPPLFAHLPLLLGPDRRRLSKRHGAKAVMEYKREGYLPEALVNFLALLGWSYDGERELFTLKELIEVFSLERVSKKGAIFDVNKLTWMNGVYIRQLRPGELFRRAKPWVDEAALYQPGDARAEEMAARALKLEQEKIKTLAEAPAAIEFFFRPPKAYDDKAEKNLRKLPRATEILAVLRDAWVATEDFTAASLETALRAVAAREEIPGGALIHAVRAALSGRAAGPSLFEMAALMGPAVVTERLNAAIEYLRKINTC